MRRAARLLGAWTLAGACLLAPVRESRAAAPEARLFMLTSTYGVMAGSLTGLASLAFYGSPGDHLRNIAVGASIGLYAGIFLGAYLIYGLPDPNKPYRPAPAAPTEKKDAEDKENPLGLQGSLAPLSTPPSPSMTWAPLLGQGVAGNPVAGVALAF